MLRLNNKYTRLRKIKKKGNILIDAVVGTAILLSMSVAVFFTLEVNEKNLALNKQSTLNIQALDYVVKELKYNYSYDEIKAKAIQQSGIYKFPVADLNIDNIKEREFFSLDKECSNNYIQLKMKEDISGAFIKIDINIDSIKNGVNISKCYSMRKVKI